MRAVAVPKLGGKLPPRTAKLAVPPGNIRVTPTRRLASFLAKHVWRWIAVYRESGFWNWHGEVIKPVAQGLILSGSDYVALLYLCQSAQEIEIPRVATGCEDNAP